jgi:beta-lactamase regulating signal transducer with metallopeptidase domain
MPQVLRGLRFGATERSGLVTSSMTQDARVGTSANASVHSIRSGALHQDGARAAAPAHRAGSPESMFATGNAPVHTMAGQTDGSNLWFVICTAAYFAVGLFLLARFFVGMVLSRRLIRSSLPIHESRALTSFSRCSATFKFSVTPQLAESDRISVPITMGILRPIILFPAEWHSWDDEELRAVLAHELSHCARHDALVQRFALLHRAIFWFSPLSWWLNMQIAELAEEASDEAVLASGADRAEYAGTLLSFFEALQANSGRVWWQGMSMAKSGTAERRVDRILAWKGAVSMNLKKSFVFAVLVVATPIVFVAAAIRPISITPGATPAPQIASAPTPAPSPQAAPTPAPMQTPTPVVASAPPLAPPLSGVTAPPMAAPPMHPPALAGVIAPAMPPAHFLHSQSNSDPSKSAIYVYSGKGKGEEQVHVHVDECDVTGSSDGAVIVVTGDTCTATDFDGDDNVSFRAKVTEHEIQFRHDGKSYVIHDQATVDRARKLFAPIFELSKKQDELGKQQSELGEKQSELGRQMTEIRVKMPDLAVELKALEEKMAALRVNGGTTSELGELQSQLGEIQSKIGEVEARAGEQQGELGEKQGALGEQQGKLGESQGKLGEEQGHASKKAAQQLKGLLDEALAHGLAKPE